MDIDAIAARIDVEAIIGRVDLVTLVEEVITTIDLPEIIRQSSGSMAYATVRGVRMRGIEADEVVERLVDRLRLRRRSAARAAAEPEPVHRRWSPNERCTTTIEAAATVPPEARPHQGRPAGIVTRGVAAAIDYGVVAGILLAAYAGWSIFLFVLDPDTYEAPEAKLFLITAAYWVVGTVYLALCWVVTGKTIGQQVMGLRVLSASGRRLRLLQALARGVFCVMFAIGLLWVVVSRRNLAVWDILLRTRVTYDWTSSR